MFPRLGILKRISVREFQRNFYKYINTTPIVITKKNKDHLLIINLNDLLRKTTRKLPTIWDKFKKAK